MVGAGSCKHEGPRLGEIAASQVRIDSSLVAEDSLEKFIEPYRRHLNEVLDAPISYAPVSLTKTDGERNTSLGNLMADIILRESDKIFRQQEGKGVDIALHNYGGLRTAISKGPVTERTAYEVMPFENAIVVVGMEGSSVRKMVDFLSRSGNPHPVAGMQVVLNSGGDPVSIHIQGKPLEDRAVYYVATSDYLVGGGGGMTFFQEPQSLYKTGYKIRNAMVDYFKQTDTLKSRVDQRFIQLPER